MKKLNPRFCKQVATLLSNCAKPIFYVWVAFAAAFMYSIPSQAQCIWNAVGPNDLNQLSHGGTNFTSIAIDGSGTPYVVFTDDLNSKKATVRKFNGGSWETVGIAGFSTGEVIHNSIAINSTGTPYVVYRDVGNGNRATVKKFNGNIWETVGSLGFSAHIATYTSIAIDGSGTPFVVYGDASISDKATVKKYNGTDWETVGTAGFSAGQVDYTSIAIDGSGKPYVVYKDWGNGGIATVKKYNGTDWETVGGVSVSAFGAAYTSIAIDGTGKPYVVYQDMGSTYTYKATVRKFNGSSWETVGSAGFSAAEAGYTSITIDNSGTPYVVYKNLGGFGSATAMKFNGSSWVTVGSAGFSQDMAESTDIAIDGSGTPYVVYRESSSFSSKARVMKFNGSSWVKVGTAGFSKGVASFTEIAIDGSGTPYVVYSDEPNDGKATVMKYNGSSWATVGTEGFSADFVRNCSIAIGGSGTPFVVYRDFSKSGRLTVKKYNGSSWVNVGIEGFSGTPTQFVSIAIDGSGTPYVVYSDEVNGGRATVKKFIGSNWVTVGTVGFSTGRADFTSIAIDGSGTPYVVYADWGNAKKATVMKFNGSVWETVGVSTAGFSTGQAVYTAIAIDNVGTPYVVYMDISNASKATVMKYNSGSSSWVIVGSAGFSQDMVESTDIAIDGSGTPYVVYRDWGSSKKATIMKFNGSAWETVGTAGFSAGPATHTSIVVNAAGTVYTAYSDGQAFAKSWNKPAAPTAAAQSFCGSATVANLVPAPSANMKWYSVPTDGTALLSNAALSTGTYYVDSTNSNGCTSSRTSVSVTINITPSAPSATATIYYAQGATANALTATGTNLKWYTMPTGGASSTTAPTPNTTTLGTTSYWVSQTGVVCESPRTKIDVIVALPATHLNFDGTNDYVALPTTANNIPAGNSNYTIEAWINPAQFGPKHIVSWGDNGQQYRMNTFRLNVNGPNNGLVNDWWGSALTVNYPFVANTWYHVAVTYDGTNRKIYVNGVIPTGGQDTPPANTHNVGTTSNVTIGVVGSITSTYFKGGMDEVRIWNVARTAAQINASKNCELQGNETGLVTYYKFNHGLSAQNNSAISTLTNAVSGGPNGTLINFAKTGTTSNWLAGSAVLTQIAPTASAQSFCGIATVANLVPAISANMKWYSAANGGTALLLTDTLTTGTYYVDSTNSNGCTTARTSVSVTVAALASGNLTQTLPVTGLTYFSNACTNNLITKLNPNGASPINGSTTAKVWVEATQSAQFVKRHYEITPATNAATSTGTVTLYFTQADFDAFNAVNTTKLPTDAADATGKANLLIEKRPGTSSDGTGLPGTYTGTPVTINPADGDIIWNAAQNRWEVSFDVTGFSGFFVKTQSFALPVTIQSFNAIQQSNDVLVKWQTSNEVNVNLYEVESSTDGQRFEKIGTVAANSTNSANSANDYAFVDKRVWASSVRYYRLKSIDNDGTFKYSAVVRLANKQQTVVAVYPNPVTNAFTIQLSDNKLLHTQAKLVDATGKTVKLITINTLMQTEEISNLPKGMYMLQLADGKVVKLIKN
jgi:hypothetical protein